VRHCCTWSLRREEHCCGVGALMAQLAASRRQAAGGRLAGDVVG
jgi:hypothetical protein